MSIELKEIEMSFGEKVLFEASSLVIPNGARVGIVGKNGSGKTTLARIIAGQEMPTKGKVSNRERVALVEQLLEKEDYHSGGEQTKAKIQQALKAHPGVLIADEPTNHLDQDGIRYLQKMLKRFSGILLLISHDRSFLNQVTTHILAIENQKLQLFEGNYQQYLAEKEKLDRNQEREYEKVQREKNELKAAIRHTSEKSKNTRKAPRRMGNSEARLHKMGDQRAKKNLDDKRKALETRLKNLPDAVAPKQEKKLHIPLTEGQQIHRKEVLWAEDYHLNVGDKTLLEAADFRLKTGKKIALIGGNGAGKSTFLKAVMNRTPAIEYAHNVYFGYFSQDFETLDEEKTILENLSETSVQEPQVLRDVLAHLQFRGDRAFQKVQTLSGGERSKVAIAKLLVSQANVLLLDEPTNHLDIESLTVLEEALQAYPGTILFISHDETFIGKLADERWQIKDKQLVFPDRQMAAPKAEEQDDLLFEIRKTNLLSQLTYAQGNEKEALEAEFAELLASKKP